jgi:hypothetical protein
VVVDVAVDEAPALDDWPARDDDAPGRLAGDADDHVGLEIVEELRRDASAASPPRLERPGARGILVLLRLRAHRPRCKGACGVAVAADRAERDDRSAR